MRLRLVLCVAMLALTRPAFAQFAQLATTGEISVTTSSAAHALGTPPTGTVPSSALVCNKGSNSVYVVFGTANTVTASSSTGTLIQPGACPAIYINGKTYFAAIGSGGNSTVVVMTGSGSASLGASATVASGGGGGGTVTAVATSGGVSGGTITTTGTLLLTDVAAVAHNWFSAVTSGALVASQPACGDLSDAAASCHTDTANATNITSGTLAAARLPAPTSSTLGGVESLAASAHKWLNAISTAGVPAATQPACADISDAGAFCSSTDAAGLSGTAVVAHGGTGASTLTAHGVLIGEATSALAASAAMTDGQVLIGQSGADPLPRTISGDGTLSLAGVLSLANTAVTAGSYGGSAAIPVLTISASGRITAASTKAVSFVRPTIGGL